MPLPWQHSFCHCRKMCLAHLHPKAHICAKFDENWSKTEEVVRGARLAPRPTDSPTAHPPAQQPDRPTTRWFLYTPLYTTCMRGYNKVRTACTVETCYNEVLGTMKITLLYQVSHYITIKKQRNIIKRWDQQNYLVIRGFCYKYPTSL